ncbi:MAG: Uma2 family endonuclease [Chroococcidiopsidaceae cyanobacterium CP_BM_RX_35]|nr:Uma2 family endonuclease [Chroococcidiopsidaceae cyanobacterium CP_BM_RX_35]
MTALTLNLDAIVQLTDDAFYGLCRANPEIKFERTSVGELIVMPPTGGETGSRNSKLNQRLANLAEADSTGITFDSSTGFKLPNGADRSPDAAWILLTRWEALTPEQRRRFPPIAPDFVVELCSDTDSLTVTQSKMQEYIDNGVRLGWLLNPQYQQVEIYRRGQDKEVLSAPTSLSSEGVLPGFVLDLRGIL